MRTILIKNTCVATMAVKRRSAVGDLLTFQESHELCSDPDRESGIGLRVVGAIERWRRIC